VIHIEWTRQAQPAQPQPLTLYVQPQLAATTLWLVLGFAVLPVILGAVITAVTSTEPRGAQPP
jgi:hypothetical protein